ncbi:MAG: ATP-binding protein [Lachnospiraceae bacterium]|nr:ATP-binding protein [Lachnospiraceae bacterium]
MGRNNNLGRTGKVQGRFLIDGVFFRMFMVMFLGMLSTVLSTVVDSVVTGQFLGSKAVAAMGLVTPMVAISNVVTGLFASGTGQLCTRNMGKADVHKVNQVFSTMMVCSVAVCTLACILMFFLSPFYISAAAKGTDAQTAAMALDYLRGFSFNIPAIGMAVFLSALMPLDNDQARCLGFTLIVLVLDFVLDLFNVLVIHGGMLGMALASVISCYVGVIWLFMHFRKPGHLLKFLPHDLCFSDVGEVLTYGIAGAIPMLMNSARGLCFNAVLIREGGTHAVAAYSAASGVFVMIAALAATIQASTSAVSSLSYGEQDARGLYRMLTNALSLSYRIYLVLGLALIAGADVFAKVFLNDPTAADAAGLAAVFIRFLAVQNAFAISSYAITGIYMGTNRMKVNYLIGVLRDGLFPCLSILVLGNMFGVRGVEASFIAAGVLTVITIVAIPTVINGKLPTGLYDFLALPKSFALDPSECLEASIDSLEGAARVSERAYGFCLERGESGKTARLVSLFIEEMGGNAVRHGVEGKRNGIVEIKLILNDEKKLIRIKDNGRPFDPVSWLNENHPEDPAANIGIRMIVGLAKDIQYVPAMNINNLLLYI